METINENSFESTISSSHQENVVPVQQKLQKSSTSSSMSTSILIGIAKTLKPHEWLLGLGAIIAMYLVNGSFASSVCALATSIPAVIHSYRVITEEKDNLLAHQVTLCYWILLGSMSICDFFLGNAFCYYFGKFILMSSVYAHVVAKSRTEEPEEKHVFHQPQTTVVTPLSQKTNKNHFIEHQTFSENQEEITTAQTQQYTLAPTFHSPLNSTVLSSVGPLTSKHSSLANYLQWTKNKEGPTTTPHSPTSSTLVAPSSPSPTEFSLHDSDLLKPNNNNNALLSCGDAKSYSTTFSAATSTFGEMPQKTNTAVSNFNEVSINSAIDGNTFLRHQGVSPHQLRSHIHTNHSSTDWSRTLTPCLTSPPSNRQSLIAQQRKTPNSILSSTKSVETLPCFENDLSSDPRHTINFKSPFNQTVKLTITNVTTNRIMWALKTNAFDRVIATPTCGFLPAGNTVHIKMAIREKSEIFPADSSRDRMAIDYVFVPDTTVAFDPSRILAKNSDARRKSFDINYVF